jgi:hypothetical protein
MKKLEIARGKVRLYFDPETAFIRMDSGGGGYSLELTPEDMLKLSGFVLGSLKMRGTKPRTIR